MSLVDAKIETKFDVSVEYNGVVKVIEVHLHQTIQHVLERAIHAFGQLSQPHTLSLFTESGEELKETLTVEQAGLKAKERLLLRASKVKGGAVSDVSIA